MFNFGRERSRFWVVVTFNYGAFKTREIYVFNDVVFVRFVFKNVRDLVAQVKLSRSEIRRSIK